MHPGPYAQEESSGAHLIKVKNYSINSNNFKIQAYKENYIMWNIINNLQIIEQ